MARLKGKLSRDQLADFDSLLLKLKELNKDVYTKKGDVVSIDMMAHLPREENDRLWKYINHYSKLTVMFPKNLNVIRSIHITNEDSSMESLIDDATMEVSLWVYRFAWRQYRSSEECGYVFTTANYGFLSWSSSFCRWREGKEAYKDHVDDAESSNYEEDALVRHGIDFDEDAIDDSDGGFCLSIDDLNSSLTNP